MIRLLSINILVTIISVTCFSLDAKYYGDSRVDITYYKESQYEINSLLNDIDIIEIFFKDNLNVHPDRPFSLTILPSVWDLTSRFNVNEKVGAIYIDNHAFFQPLVNLKSKKYYFKTLFTEYGHYYIDRVTNNNCPPWLNEGLTYYYWLIFSGESSIKTKMNLELPELKGFSNMMHSPEMMREYYSSIVILLDSIFKESDDINRLVLLLKDYSFNESIKIIEDK